LVFLGIPFSVETMFPERAEIGICLVIPFAVDVFESIRT